MPNQMNVGQSAEIINLFGGAQELRRSEPVTPFPNPYRDFFNVCQATFNLCLVHFYKASLPEHERKNRQTCNIETLVRHSGFPPLQKMMETDGRHPIAQYVVSAGAMTQPIKMELRMDVSREGQDISIYHGDVNGNGHQLNLRREAPGLYGVCSYVVLQNGQHKQNLVPEAKDIDKIFADIVPIINRQNAQRRTDEATQPIRGSANIRLVI